MNKKERSGLDPAAKRAVARFTRELIRTRRKGGTHEEIMANLLRDEQVVSHLHVLQRYDQPEQVNFIREALRLSPPRFASTESIVDAVASARIIWPGKKGRGGWLYAGVVHAQGGSKGAGKTTMGDRVMLALARVHPFFIDDTPYDGPRLKSLYVDPERRYAYHHERFIKQFGIHPGFVFDYPIREAETPEELRGNLGMEFGEEFFEDVAEKLKQGPLPDPDGKPFEGWGIVFCEGYTTATGSTDENRSYSAQSVKEFAALGTEFDVPTLLSFHCVKLSDLERRDMDLTIPPRWERIRGTGAAVDIPIAIWMLDDWAEILDMRRVTLRLCSLGPYWQEEKPEEWVHGLYVGDEREKLLAAHDPPKASSPLLLPGFRAALQRAILGVLAADETAAFSVLQLVGVSEVVEALGPDAKDPEGSVRQCLGLLLKRHLTEIKTTLQGTQMWGLCLPEGRTIDELRARLREA